MKDTKTGTRQITVRLSDDLWKAVRVWCIQRDIKINDLAEKLFTDFLTKEGKS